MKTLRPIDFLGIFFFVYPFSGYVCLFLAIFLAVNIYKFKIPFIDYLKFILFLIFIIYLCLKNDKDIYLIGILLQILICYLWIKKSNYDYFIKLIIVLLIFINFYCFSFILPSFYILGINQYLYIYNPFTSSIGSSVYVANMMSVCVVLTTILITFTSERRLTNFGFLILVPILIAGMVTGSRTFIIIFASSVILLVFKFIYFEGISRLKKFLFFFGGIIAIIYIFTSGRISDQGLKSSRFKAWSDAIQNYNIMELHSISSLDDIFLVSSFHNIVLDAFYLYQYDSFILLGLYTYFLLKILYLIMISKIDYFKKIILFYALFSSVILCFTSVFWRGDTNAPTIIMFAVVLAASFPKIYRNSAT